MNRNVKAITNYFIKRPRNIFLLDSLGAMLTAFFLLVVLRSFSKHIGIPKTTLTYLSIVAACFCFYSAACFLFLKKNWARFIRLIGMANLLYCMVTLGLLMHYAALLTTMGLAYFLGEIIIIGSIVYIELKVATASK
ncbi:hypothetical protein [Niabella hibiscisoli]|uniref:hypothetical protein n=1 Tax=Niabella hibiscisoli TaxID=1825928 RepID=UPI001F0EAED9|nr:hypothetical protein [Niabella hibiscisoli]MCH5720554.1 hypothetical protein [Niabella hibiscisoli]